MTNSAGGRRLADRRAARLAPFAAILAVVPALLLKDWYCLSDEALKDELRERDSFRRFCGFRAADQIPDHTTICRFRNDLAPPAVSHSNRHATPSLTPPAHILVSPTPPSVIPARPLPVIPA